MNGRVYDYNLGRFLSVDPFIQLPGHSQAINPYSYVLNNPLAGTDPTGYVFFIPAIPVILEIGGGALALYGSWETGQAVGNAYNDVSSGRKTLGQAANDAALSVAIDAGLTATGAGVLKLAPSSLVKKLDDFVSGKGNGADNSVELLDNDSTALGAHAARAVDDARASGQGYGKSGAAGALEVPEETAALTGNKYYTAGSKEAGKTTEVHPVIKQEYDNVPEDMRTGSHGKCAEAACLTKVLNDVEKATGAPIKTTEQAKKHLEGSISDIRETSNSKGAGSGKAACDSCSGPLDNLGVEDVNK